jgi:hypothetical protein
LIFRKDDDENHVATLTSVPQANVVVHVELRASTRFITRPRCVDTIFRMKTYRNVEVLSVYHNFLFSHMVPFSFQGPPVMTLTRQSKNMFTTFDLKTPMTTYSLWPIVLLKQF